MTRMIEACRENNVKLGCVFQRRLMKEAIETRRLWKEVNSKIILPMLI